MTKTITDKPQLQQPKLSTQLEPNILSPIRHLHPCSRPGNALKGAEFAPAVGPILGTIPETRQLITPRMA